MFFRELKFNFKNLCIWSVVTIVLFLVVFLVYPSIMNSSQADQIDEMMKIFPEEMLKAFNMDIASIDNVYGWLKSEGFVFILLIIGCYSGILGSNILLKEESDGTIEYLATLPIKRTNIVLTKSIIGVFYITVFTAIIGIFNFIGLKLSGSFDEKQFILLSITPLLSSYLIFFICLFLSTFTNKTQKMLGISLGVVFVSYLLNTLSSLAKEVEFLKYFSAFTLADIRNVITNTSIDYKMIIASIVGSIIFLALTIIRYTKKELV